MPHTLSRRALARGLSILLLCAACTLCAAKTARAKATVVASIPELAAIAAEVGGDAVTVHTIAKPGQDYHSIEPRPSDVARLARATLVVRTGADLDSWMTALTNATGNTQLRAGGRRSVDASQGVPKIEVPTGSISGAQGDVHPSGNPHFYYDPVYAVFAARNITRGLVRADAANAAVYRAGYTRFRADMARRTTGWQRTLTPFRGRGVVTYHRTYNYFLRRFGVRQFATLEPRPGIPPSARHIAGLLQRMKEAKVRALLVESIYPARYPNLVARGLNTSAVRAPYSVASTRPGAYAAMMDRLVEAARQALAA